MHSVEGRISFNVYDEDTDDDDDEDGNERMVAYSLSETASLSLRC